MAIGRRGEGEVVRGGDSKAPYAQEAMKNYVLCR